ncbi:hypothetical protein ABTX99_22150 [Streptomyces flaveolus]
MRRPPYAPGPGPGVPGNRFPRFAPRAEPVIEYGVRGLGAVAAEFHGTRD